MAKQKPPSNPQANLLRQMQRMQQDMADAQAALAEETVEGSAGGGVVKATVTGAGDLRSVSISPDVVDPEDVEMLEDLVVAAVTDALRAAQERQAQAMGGMTGGLDLGALGGLLG
ncbi:MAG TPA: YbaB/EbfC family nucleoid-associated protein [Acidimicrobiia bacterium]|nr:YbaB/EbfC family nucleoid-associated protein [Acidimicrobiia bacterium]